MIKIETVGKPYMRYLAKVIPLAFDESMSYYEQVCSIAYYLINEVMPTINNNAEAVVELQNLYDELKEYVDNYFDNLDIQTEVDNKLEEMYENGQLATLVSQFLQLQALFVYNDVASMQLGTNFTNGSIVKTLHFRDNDNGGAYYKIRTVTNEDVIDNITLFAITNLETLVAELIPEYKMNTDQFGFTTNEDNTIRFDKIVDYINENIIKELNINEGVYTLSDKFVIEDINNLTITGKGTLDNGNSETVFLEIKNGNNISIENITIKSEYQYANPTTTNNAIGCLCIDTCSNFEINNLKINKVNGGLFIINSHDGNIHDNYINDCKSWGLMIGEYGLRHFYKNYNLLIHSNMCTNGYDGIKLTGYIKNISIYDNLCTNNSRDGIDFAGFSAEKIYIYNNKLYENSINAIEFKQLDRATYTPDPLESLVFKDISIKNNDMTDNIRGIVMNIFYDDSVKDIDIGYNKIYRANSSSESTIGFYSDCINSNIEEAINFHNNYMSGNQVCHVRLYNSNNVIIQENNFDYNTSASNINLLYSPDRDTTYGCGTSNIKIVNNKIKNNNDLRLFAFTNASDMTNIEISNNGFIWNKSSQYVLPVDYPATAITFVNNYDIRKYSTAPTGRSIKNIIYYSNDPSSTSCIGWIPTSSTTNPTYKQYIPIS